MFSFFLHQDNMGLICNQLEGKPNDEVITTSIDAPSTTLAAAVVRSHTNNNNSSSKRRRKLKQFSLNPQNFLHNLFKWYFKSTSSLHDDDFACASTLHCSNNGDAEHDLVYREHKRKAQVSPSSIALAATSSSSLSCDNYQQRSPRRRRSSSHHPPTTTAAAAAATSAPSSSNLSLTNSHYYIRQSICLYAASSVILALCYLVTPSTAATDSASHPV